jgi:hypothetical protein
MSFNEQEYIVEWFKARFLSDTAPIDGPPLTRGNAKLGKDIYTWNRPYEVTCPQDCPLLQVPIDSGKPSCYANPFQRSVLIKNMYKAALRRLPYAPNLLRLKQNATVRFHVAGDFNSPFVEALAGSQFYGEKLVGKLDVPYIRAIVKQLRERRDLFCFGYTHMWRSMVTPLSMELRDLMTLHASVSTIAEAAEARDLGWRVALTGNDVPQPPKAKPAGLALLGPRSVDIGNGKIPICPEQLGGRAQDCGTCRLCIGAEGVKGVAFISH